MGNEPPVVVAERNNKGLYIPECVHCRQLHFLEESQLGIFLACPINGKLLEIGSLVGVKEKDVKENQKTEVSTEKASQEAAAAKQVTEEDLLLKIVMDQHEKKSDALDTVLQKYQPEKLKAHLDDYIIGQEQAKLEMATALYYHVLALDHDSRSEKKKLSSLGPILFAGPTGCGKTFLIETACRYAGTPFVHINCAAMVSEGIVGTSIGDIAREAMQQSGKDVKKAEFSVVFLDEFDKALSSHPYGQGVLSQLLRVIEGSDLRFGSGSDASSLSTRRMLFLLGGAFQEIFTKADRRPPGYTGGDKNKKKKMTAKAIEKEMEKRGIPREFLGRIRSTVVMDLLGERELLSILLNSLGSPLKKYCDMVEAHGDKIEIEPEALKLIARTAAESGIGARALEEILYRVFQPILYVAPRQEKTQFAITRQGVGNLLRVDPGACQ